MYVLNPYYFIQHTSWITELLFGYRWKVTFHYAIERETRDVRYADDHYVDRGCYKTLAEAEARCKELETILESKR